MFHLGRWLFKLIVVLIAVDFLLGGFFFFGTFLSFFLDIRTGRKFFFFCLLERREGEGFQHFSVLFQNPKEKNLVKCL